MKPSANRSLVVKVASQLFLLRGLANTSMDEVVKESGVSKSNIYYHFKSKEELLLAVLQYRIDLLQSTLQGVLQNKNLSVKVRIQLIFAELAKELEGRDCIGGCPILSLLVVPVPEIKEHIQLYCKELRTVMGQLLSEGVQSGELRKDIDIVQTATLLVSVVEGSVMLAETQRDASVLIQAGETMLHLLQV